MYSFLENVIRLTVKKTYEYTVKDVVIEIPQDVSMGDIALPIALQLSKILKTAPLRIATVLVSEIQKLPQVSKVEIAGPGYINIFLTPQFLLTCLASVELYTRPQPVKTNVQPVIIEYSQPNIAKPLGVHHLIGTIVGQAVSNIYEFLGYPVIRWNYLGDYGTQFGKLAVAKNKYAPLVDAKKMSVDELLDLYVRFHEDAESNVSLEEEARAASKKLEDGDEILREFWQDVVTITKASLQGIYARLHVHFDLDLGESFYEDKMTVILEEGKKKGVFTTGKEGALIVDFHSDEMPPYVVQRGDGGTLYSTRDIAQMRYRIDTYHPSEILIFTDIAQKLHFEQLIATCALLAWELPPFTNVLFGRMRFADKKMSTRKGTILKLEEVLDEAYEEALKTIDMHGDAVQTDNKEALAEMMGIGALSYGILSQNRKGDLVFDWSKFLAFEGNSAPYIQYTHARAQSLLRKGDFTHFDIPTVDQLTVKERQLLHTLTRWPVVLDQARTSHMPHLVCTYLYSLCQIFNSFYSVEPIVQAPEPLRALRLNLTYMTATVLRTGASILTIAVPDRM